MKQNNSIKHRVAGWILNKRVAKLSRQKKTMNLDLAKSALVIMDGKDTSSFGQVVSFVQFLSEKKIAVDTISYHDQKETDKNSTENELILTHKEQNWLGIPKKEIIDPVITKEHGLLFDFSIKHYFAIEYIVELSKAKFKIGMLPGQTSEYDFMIDLGNGRNIQEFIKQIKTYLPLLK